MSLKVIALSSLLFISCSSEPKLSGELLGGSPELGGEELPIAPPTAGASTGGVTLAGGAMSSAGVESSPWTRSDGLPPAPLSSPQLRFPVADEDRALISTRVVIGVDHDPAVGDSMTDCLSRDGMRFPFCYDDHRGSDFILEGGFVTMDAGSARVVAASSGVVVALHDGEYDRCHADLSTGDVSCDGYEMRPNYITLRHDEGWESSYLHLKAGSLLVTLGDEVRCGQAIALIGSSGYSSAPHLHFELEGPLGRTWDPFAGAHSQMYSLWADEGTEALPLAICSP